MQSETTHVPFSGKLKKVLKKIGLVLFGTLVALLLLEGGLRIAGAVFSSEQKQTSRRGIDFDDENQYRILCLGESTTAETYPGGVPGAWPMRLERILNSRTKGPRTYKVINEGVLGTVTALIVARLEAQIETYRPHLVITMMGINDVRSTIRYATTSTSRAERFFADLRVTKFFRIFFNAAAHGFAEEEEPPPPPPPKPFVEEPEKMKALGQKITAGDTAGAQAIVDELIRKYPQKEKSIYHIYTNIVRTSPNMELPQNLPFRMRVFNRMLALDVPKSNISGQIYAKLTFQYYRNKQYDKYFEATRNAIRYLEDERDRMHYVNYYIFHSAKMNRQDPYVQVLKKKYNMSTAKGSRYDATRHHYKTLLAILKKHNIKYAAMQYPTRDVRLLRYFLSDAHDPAIETDAGMYLSHKPDSKYDEVLKDDDDVIFISNEASFAVALSSRPYTYYFVDRFGGTFGHTTAVGHELIAKTAADALLATGILKR